MVFDQRGNGRDSGGVSDMIKMASNPGILKRISILTFALATSIGVRHASLAQNTNTLPGIEQIELEILEFQRYFKNRFPGTRLEDFSKGAFGLPQFGAQKISRQLLSTIPPYEHNLNKIEHQWTKRFGTLGSLADCMQRYPGAYQFPFAFNGEVITVEKAINQCISSLGKSELAYNSDNLNRFSAIFRSQFRGQATKTRYTDTDLRRQYQQGRQLFWSKRGQNDYSCASCHVENAGNRLSDEVVSTSLGQSNSFPLYSPNRVKKLKSIANSSNQNWLSLHDQYSLCFIRSGAVPLLPQSEPYIALEVYQSVLDTGVPLSAPGFRP